MLAILRQAGNGEQGIFHFLSFPQCLLPEPTTRLYKEVISTVDQVVASGCIRLPRAVSVTAACGRYHGEEKCRIRGCRVPLDIPFSTQDDRAVKFVFLPARTFPLFPNR